MNTYKLAIESDINVTALKDYTLKFVDMAAKNEFEAIATLQKEHGNKFFITLVSKL
jgi:hypothetical protein